MPGNEALARRQWAFKLSLKTLRPPVVRIIDQLRPTENSRSVSQPGAQPGHEIHVLVEHGQYERALVLPIEMKYVMMLYV